MEKLRGVDSPSRPSTRRQSTKALTTSIVLFLTISILLLLRRPDSVYHHDGQPSQDNTLPQNHGSEKAAVAWDEIVPSERLTWTPCFPIFGPNFYCARLTVPMDYTRRLNESASHPKVHVAMVLLPGSGHKVESGIVAESPLLLNPGGPGGSGTSLVLAAGYSIQGIVGSHHDLIGFDPRGIAATLPQTDCFDASEPDQPADEADKPNALLRRLTWQFQDLGVVSLSNHSDLSLANAYIRSTARNRMCETKDGEDSIYRYAGTPYVAQDMMSIVKAWDGWTGEFDNATTADETNSETVHSPPGTKGKLVYWGFSYGTALGATFASMFPESVGRLILDGVVDTDRHKSAGDIWSSSLQDTDAVLNKFFYYCHEAKQACHFYRDGDEMADIEERFYELLAKIGGEPLTYVPAQAHIPVVLDLSIMKAAIFVMLYFPITTFPLLALWIDMIYRGLDLSPLTSPPDLVPICSIGGKLLVYPDDSAIVIGCNDETFLFARSLEDYKEIGEELRNVTYFADTWMNTIASRCAGWNIKPEFPPALDWDRFPSDGNPPINTSFPIMFLSNTFDPVTPLEQGLVQAGRFVGSGFVEHLTEGHSTLAAASLCTIGKIRAYLDNGIVPSPPKWDGGVNEAGHPVGKWEKCAVHGQPFKKPGTFDQVYDDESFWSEREVTIVTEAVKEVQRHLLMSLGHDKMPHKLRSLLAANEDAASYRSFGNSDATNEL